MIYQTIPNSKRNLLFQMIILIRFFSAYEICMLISTFRCTSWFADKKFTFNRVLHSLQVKLSSTKSNEFIDTARH